jgi:myo-inositol-1(or 4)-monophosphatase
MVTEAGGKVTDFKGQPFDIYSEEMVASNGLIHNQMIEVIKGVNSQNGVGV